jgi:putative two-component system response regulator
MNIPLVARVTSIADVYDALVCARVYKAAFSYEQAVNIIVEGKGTQFDPQLINAMLEIQERFKEISIEYK